MTPARLTDLKVPTAAQLAKKVDELVAERERQRLDIIRRQVESQAMAELSAELNAGRIDTLVAEGARQRGMTFVRDVWPDHPAAGHLVAEPVFGPGGLGTGSRPCGVRHPFRLEKDGLWFCDYWLASPLFPCGRLPEGDIVVAFKVGNGWRTAVPNAPTRNTLGDMAASGGFEALRAAGLKVNPKPLKGRPEQLQPDDKGTGVYIEGSRFDFGGQAAADAFVRHPDDLLWRFVNATANECPADLPTAAGGAA